MRIHFPARNPHILYVYPVYIVQRCSMLSLRALKTLRLQYITRKCLYTSALRYQNPTSSEPFLNGTSSNYLEDIYEAWLRNPDSVHKVFIQAYW